MAFVNEKYSTEEKLFVDSLVEKRPPLTRKGSSSKWTVDREKNAFLVLVGKEGGTYEGTQETEHYVLSWDGELIHFAGDATFQLSTTVENSNDMSWRIHRLVVPPALEHRQSEVFQIIEEALDALGWLYSRSRVGVLNVNFDLSSSR